MHTHRLYSTLIIAPLGAFCCLMVLMNSPITALGQGTPKQHSVEVSAVIQESPPQIRLVWPGDGNSTGYTVSRKSPDSQSWGNNVELPGDAPSWTDANVQVGTAYEYQIMRRTRAMYEGTGYICAGIRIPLIENRGRLILLVESTYAGALAAELARLEQDLIGDGWTVVRQDVSRNDSVPDVKAKIRAIYSGDPSNTRALFLFGNIPVPYSGNIAPDGHANHRGAWPADVYYADMDGTWTDDSVNATDAERRANWNTPGDGKFDQSSLPSDAELQTGRVDLSNLTNFQNKQPSRSELDLLRQYLNKNHNWRQGRLNVRRRAAICDNFGLRERFAVAASGWRNFAAFFGAENTVELPVDGFVPAVTSDSYLWSYGAGGGSFYYSSGVLSADDWALNDVRVVFTLFLGSYYGDWNNESNFLRSALGSSSYTLTAVYSGFPHSYFQHMALGQTIGFGIRLTQNNKNDGVYQPTRQGTYQVHTALLGDPSLRMHPVQPPSNLAGSSANGRISLAWSSSPDSDLQGYHVYRAASPAGPFTRVTGDSPIGGTSFTEQAAQETATYMVRAIKLERSGSGSYFNPSQGIFVTVRASGGGDPDPGNGSVQLAQPSFTGEGFAFEARNAGSANLVIEISTDLTQWVQAGGVTIANGRVIDQQVNRFEQQRFYRCRVSQ